MEMVGFIRSVGTSSMFVSLLTETEVDMVKKDRATGQSNPYLGTIKVSRRNGLLNVNFVKSVERNMEKSGVENPTYVPGTTWYVHESTEEGKPLPLCVHKKDSNRFYLQYFPHRSIGENRYFLRGQELTPEQVKDMERFLSVKKASEFKPIVITLAIDSIREMKARSIKMLNHTVSRLQKRFENVGIDLNKETLTKDQVDVMKTVVRNLPQAH